MRIHTTLLLIYASFIPLALSANGDLTACPSFKDGSWKLGELRNFTTIKGTWSGFAKNYTSKTPRACCDICDRVEGCTYWTLKYKTKTSYLGDCLLFRSFSCNTSYDGKLPFIKNKLARTGADQCNAPSHSYTSGSFTLEDKRDATVVEMRALLNAEITVRESEAEKSAEEAKKAEKRKYDAEELAGHYREKALNLTYRITSLKAELDQLETELTECQTNFTEAATKAGHEASTVLKHKNEHKRLKEEVIHAKKAKEVADLLLATEEGLKNKQKMQQVEQNPTTSCPSKLINDKEWVIGLLRNLTDSDGKATQLDAALNDVFPKKCCEECGKIEGCAFWTWSQPSRNVDVGDCSFFTKNACEVINNESPFQRNTKLGRVGPVCPATTQ